MAARERLAVSNFDDGSGAKNAVTEALEVGCSDGLPPDLSAAYLDIYRAVRPMLATRNNDVHTRVSCQFAVEILRREEGDPRIVIPAIFLHDVGWHVVGEGRLKGAYGPKADNDEFVRLHEAEGATIARRVLSAQTYPEGLTDEICRIISRHDSGTACASPEEAIVKDADKCYRATLFAFMYFPAEVDTSLQGWYEWLVDGYRHWMFRAWGRKLAEACLESTRRELGLVGEAAGVRSREDDL